ncbi:predicted protein [Coccidioides posadasii str. Silveira]|uniref:Predicted protein n=2 Tax=Coccidioides posadasii TaxID=199306 RepID=E9CSE0_COCPS|nr:predicted protein [Coccidioides posadasii str. Silveira]KMM63862.1 hypothetical protein CPAG_00214 [Coccidioides posadasii RMSCC 3488]
MWRGGGNEELNTLAVKGMSDGKQYSPLVTCKDNQATGPGANIGQGKPLRRSHFVVVQADEEREDNVKEPGVINHCLGFATMYGVLRQVTWLLIVTIVRGGLVNSVCLRYAVHRSP